MHVLRLSRKHGRCFASGMMTMSMTVMCSCQGGRTMQGDEIRFARCQRCNLSMRVRVKPGNPEALLMRYSETGEGLCASCAATLFLYSVEHIKSMIDEKREMLLWVPTRASRQFD